MEKERPIELAANFEGNATELLFGRLHNEKIKNQILDLLFKGEQSRVGTFIEALQTDENGDLVFDASGEPIVKEKVPYVPKTKEELEQWYDETLKGIESVTEIAPSEKPHDLPTVDTMYTGAVAPWSGKPFTVKQMSIIEAHEKGHRIRDYMGDYFNDYFKAGFDFDDVPYGPDDLTIYRKSFPPEDESATDEEVKEMFFEYLSMPMELTERMSQLKNYFGMDSDHTFTKEHLDYARIHYIPDTDMDNGMKQFFQAITPETEDAFLELINSAGV